MQESFEEFLTEKHADADTIQQAAKSYLAERTDYFTPDEMRRQLIEVVGDANEVNSALRTLENDPVLRENACLALLSSAWEEPAEAERVQSSIESAKTKLPVIETAILAIVAMYGMYTIRDMYLAYLATTGGKESEETDPKKGTRTTKWYGPTAPLNAIVSLFHKGGQQPDNDGKGGVDSRPTPHSKSEEGQS